eukprot:6462528-Amphidinium_carterae.1
MHSGKTFATARTRLIAECSHGSCGIICELAGSTAMMNLLSSARGSQSSSVGLRERTFQWSWGPKIYSHFAEKLSPADADTYEEWSRLVTLSPAIDPNFTKDELETVISQLPRGKCTGCDRVVLESFVLLDSDSLERLVSLINECFRERLWPACWESTTTVLLAKVPTPGSCKDLRPIAVLPITMKLASKMMLNRIKDRIDDLQPPESFGFRPNKQCSDCHTILRLLATKFVHWKWDISICKLDVAKAFDSVEHPALFRILQDASVPADALHFYQYLYSRVQTSHQFANVNTDAQRVCRGVLQGDPSSPSLFISVMAAVWKKTIMDWDAHFKHFGWHLLEASGTQLQDLLAALHADSHLFRKGVPDYGLLYSSDHKVLYGFYFADDVHLFCHDPRHLQQMTESLAEKLSEVGLALNPSKVQWMTSSLTPPAVLTVHGTEITPVRPEVGFTVLGSCFTLTESASRTLQHRLASGWRKFYATAGYLKSRRLGEYTRLQALHRSVLPCLLWGLQSCYLTQSVYKQLDVVLLSMLSRMIRVPRGEGQPWVDYYIHRRRVGRRKWLHYDSGLSTAFQLGGPCSQSWWMGCRLCLLAISWRKRTQLQFSPGRPHDMHHEGRGSRTRRWETLFVETALRYSRSLGLQEDDTYHGRCSPWIGITGLPSQLKPLLH